MKQIKKLPNLNINLNFSEKIKSSPNKDVCIRTQEEITQYKKVIGYRKARVKRYGKVPAKKAR